MEISVSVGTWIHDALEFYIVGMMSRQAGRVSGDGISSEHNHGFIADQSSRSITNLMENQRAEDDRPLDNMSWTARFKSHRSTGIRSRRKRIRYSRMEKGRPCIMYCVDTAEKNDI